MPEICTNVVRLFELEASQKIRNILRITWSRSHFFAFKNTVFNVFGSEELRLTANQGSEDVFAFIKEFKTNKALKSVI
jgi:hypothetical protein